MSNSLLRSFMCVWSSQPRTSSSTPEAVPQGHAVERQAHLVAVLKFIQALASSSSLPPEMLSSVLRVITVAVNMESHASWAALNAVLSTTPSKAIVGLIEVINSTIAAPLPSAEYNVASARGAVFCLGMAMWGSKRVEGGRCFWREAVEAMSRLIKVERSDSSLVAEPVAVGDDTLKLAMNLHPVLGLPPPVNIRISPPPPLSKEPSFVEAPLPTPSVVFEVALSAHRLIRKFKAELHHEWIPMIDTLSSITAYLSSPPKNTSSEGKDLLNKLFLEFRGTLSCITSMFPSSLSSFRFAKKEMVSMLLHASIVLPVEDERVVIDSVMGFMVMDTLPHKTGWVAACKFFIDEFFYRLDKNEYKHPPGTRLKALSSLFGPDGPVEVTRNVREWWS